MGGEGKKKRKTESLQWQEKQQKQQTQEDAEGTPGTSEARELLDFPSPEQTSKHTVYQILTEPHTITALLVTGGLLAWFALTHDYGPVGNTKVGVASAAAVFLVFALCEFPDGMFRRPHPLVWRVVTGMGVLYLLFLVFMLCQNLD